MPGRVFQKREAVEDYQLHSFYSDTRMESQNHPDYRTFLGVQ